MTSVLYILRSEIFPPRCPFYKLNQQWQGTYCRVRLPNSEFLECLIQNAYLCKDSRRDTTTHHNTDKRLRSDSPKSSPLRKTDRRVRLETKENAHSQIRLTGRGSKRTILLDDTLIVVVFRRCHWQSHRSQIRYCACWTAGSTTFSHLLLKKTEINKSYLLQHQTKSKGFPHLLTSVGLGADPGVHAVSPQVPISKLSTRQ